MHISAPGKLFLSGEWSVLEGNPGLVVAVNKRVHCVIEENNEISVSIDDYRIKDARANFDGKKISWVGANEYVNEKLIFTKGALETALQYIGSYKPFKIRTWGEETSIEVDGVRKKIGFGSSAAATVAIIAAVLAYHGKDIRSRNAKDIIYKLAAIAHYLAQGKIGSSFDIAASAYGGAFVYRKFDSQWLMKELENIRIKELAEKNWQDLYIEELIIPENFHLLVGWTKEPASTSAMVKQMNEFKKANPDRYDELMATVAKAAKDAINAWKRIDKERLLSSLQKNEDALRKLGKVSGVNIETDDLRLLSDTANERGGAGKLSGAGGGDCGIAVCFDKNTADKIKKAWNENGFYLVNTNIDKEGIKIEK